MRKKIVATLLVGAIAATGVMGLSACGGLSVNSGAEVADEAAWKAAFSASLNAENYTAEGYEYEETGSSELNSKNVRTNSEGKVESSGKAYYSETGVYWETSYTDNEKEVAGSEQEYYNVTKKEQRYIEYGDTNWMATYSYNNYDTSDGKSTTESYWAAREGSYSGDVLTVDILNSYFYSSESAILPSTLSDLFDSFEYKNGLYVAVLYTKSISSSFAAVSVNVSVAIKDGYVVGYQTESSREESNGDDYNKYYSKTVGNFSNYGKTTVKAPSAALKAVEKAKSEAE